MHIRGPAGQLEAALDIAPHEKTITAILCHPHPQYGGSMNDAVIATTAGVLLNHGINCLRFNFRGVGSSSGAFDQGQGEQADLAAVFEWVEQEYPRDKIWLAGYSFGASIVWQSLATLAPARALLIAPPVGAMTFAPTAFEGDVQAIAGDEDNFVDTNAFMTLFGDNGHILDGADHFFSGQHEALAKAIDALV